MPDGLLRLVPCSLAFNDYYRGELEYHPECKPSLLRPWMTGAKQFVERVKFKELCLLMENYPLVQIYKDGLCMILPDGSKQNYRLTIDYLALAQHYGICTEVMDFTVDKFVAAFFACTDYDKETDTYTPHDETVPRIVNGKKKYVTEGCFYHFVDKALLPGEVSNFRSVGLQPFSRPGEQAGFVLAMKTEQDLNNMVERAIHFKHDKKIAEFIYNYTNRSNKLFPQSVLQKKAIKIRDSKIFSHKAFSLAKDEFYPNAEDSVLYDYLAGERVELQDNPIVSFTQEEIDKFYKDWKDHGEKEFYDKILVRYAFYGPTRDEVAQGQQN